MFIKNKLVYCSGISCYIKKSNLVKHKPLKQRNVASTVCVQVKNKGVGNIVQNEYVIMVRYFLFRYTVISYFV